MVCAFGAKLTIIIMLSGFAANLERKMEKARIYVNFNEMITENIVLLSKDDTKKDSKGNIIAFYEGMPVSIYMDDDDEDGKPDNLIADGIAIKYDLSKYNLNYVKWCCKIDENGIRHESDIKKL
jgi:hypothetical protein